MYIVAIVIYLGNLLLRWKHQAFVQRHLRCFHSENHTTQAILNNRVCVRSIQMGLTKRIWSLQAVNLEPVTGFVKGSAFI